jgi:hypothetical protein
VSKVQKGYTFGAGRAYQVKIRTLQLKIFQKKFFLTSHEKGQVVLGICTRPLWKKRQLCKFKDVEKKPSVKNGDEKKGPFCTYHYITKKFKKLIFCFRSRIVTPCSCFKCKINPKSHYHEWKMIGDVGKGYTFGAHCASPINTVSDGTPQFFFYINPPLMSPQNS